MMLAMERQQRRHVSFSGVIIPAALLAVATLSLITVLVGMRFVTSSTHSQAQGTLSLQVNSPDENIVYDRPHAHSLYNGRNRVNTDDITNNEADALHVRVGSRSDKAFPENTFGAEKYVLNNKHDETDEASSHSLSYKRKHVPRIISINGGKGNWTNYLSGESDSKKRVIDVSKIALQEQERLLDSDDFSYRDSLYEGDCVPMQKWQETSFPNCNLFHELDYLGNSIADEFEFYTNGGYNQIFRLWLNEEDKKEDPVVIKILHWGTAYTDRNYDRVRRDGLILERLTRSTYVLDSYGFCGFEVLTPYAGGGTFSNRMRQWQNKKLKLSPRTRLQYAMETAAGLADVHDIDGEGLSSVAHGDLKGGQYLFLDGVIKLGDFNRGRFLRRNSTAPNTACAYTIGKNDAAFRSPEEYAYLPQTSAIDVWALGSILYEILTGREVWHDTKTKEAQKYIRKGKLPTIADKYMNSEHPVDVALREAISMCFIFDPKERAKAEDVASFLREKLSEMPKE